MLVPVSFPVFSANQLAEMSEKPISSCIADILNLFYDLNISGWDIEFCVGRHPIRLANVGNRITIAECWRNPQWCFSGFIRNVTDLICPGETPTFWDETAIRIAVLVAVTLRMMGTGEIDSEHPLDVAVHSGNFSAPLSAWYARKMGLPLGNIVCCCNENGSLWELIHQGQLRTDGIARKTRTPEGDVWIPEGLEQFVYSCGGYQEVQKYRMCCMEGVAYEPSDGVRKELCTGMYVTVAGDNRMLRTISGFWSGYSYLLSPYTALVYSGVQDYRVNVKENRRCLILAERSPECDLETVAEALHVSAREVQKLL